MNALPDSGSPHTIVLIKGDGIGPEVIGAARTVLEASGVSINWIEAFAGLEHFEKTGEVLPAETLDILRLHKVSLKGPTATPIGGGHTSVNVQIRQRLNLFAAVRPVRSIEGIDTRYKDVELVIVRENTEGLYSGIEHQIIPGVVESLKIVTEKACTRISEFGFNYAQKNQRKNVTVFHKANILKMADGLFLKCSRAVHEKSFKDVEYHELIIDNGCMQIVRDPSRFDVLILDNFYGDIISDLCAGLVGGLGVVPGANFGDDCAIFESVHGSAPDIAGKGVANPLAAIMSGVMMLNHLGERAAAERIKSAYNAVLASRDPAKRTRDIGGTGDMAAFVEAILREMQ